MNDKIGIPTKVPQELPLPAPCVGLLILPIRQTYIALHCSQLAQAQGTIRRPKMPAGPPPS